MCHALFYRLGIFQCMKQIKIPILVILHSSGGLGDLSTTPICCLGKTQKSESEEIIKILSMSDLGIGSSQDLRSHP